MDIHVARGSSPLGVYTQAQVAEGLNNGEIRFTDLAWREGMSAWTPLNQWPEFSATRSDSSVNPFIPKATIASTVPWEKTKSWGSFWATIKGAIVDPRQTFASGSFKFSSYIIFSYISIFICLPFSIYGQLRTPQLNEQLADYLRSMHNPALDSAIAGLAQSQPVYFGIIGIICVSVVYPFLLALGGIVQWVGLKIFRQKVSIEQSMVSVVVGVSVSNLCFAPIILAAAHFWIYFILSLLLSIPIFILHCRASAAVMKISPWVLFFSWTALAVIPCFCCGCCIGMLGSLGR
ncbi:MAG: DUF4339 domain-containing protein [Verrucomicrobia bacterium]|nr:DUF4339 domain-containing protein [Verrucomicrobiota bacterium]